MRGVLGWGRENCEMEFCSISRWSAVFNAYSVQHISYHGFVP